MESKSSEGEGLSGAMESNGPDDSDVSDSEFVEMDQTGRYGRYNEVLGKGAFKTVYRAFDEVDGIEVAWNQVKIHDLLQSPEDLDRLYSEVHLLKSLKHKNIIKFYTSWVDVKNENVNFITEIFNSGTLRQYRKKHKHVDIKAVKNWARQILRGLLYLHSHDPPIIHRDLKCDNIFVNGNNGEVKIGDLGLATILRQADAAHSVIGTPEFMAPELYEEEYNELVDIYSFGMCLLELVTFEYPYSECTNAAQIYKKVTSGKKPAALERVKDPDVRKFIENCLAVASKRLPARELLSDPFLQCDVNKEHSDCRTIPSQSLPSKVMLGDDFDDLIIKKELEPVLNGEVPLKLIREASQIFVSHDLDVPRVSVPVESVYGNDQVSSILKAQQPLRSLDFKVKGQKRDECTMFLRLRITDSEGHVRHIHFLFDTEGDTAISVAREMVEELQISDQDVTTIAEMIDVQILALVPDWKPGASFDETGPDTEDFDQKASVESCRGSPLADAESNHVDCNEINTILMSESIYSPLRPSAYNDPSTQGEGMMFGRFEEFTYNQEGSDFSPSSSGVPPVSGKLFDDPIFSECTSPEFDKAGNLLHGTVTTLQKRGPNGDWNFDKGETQPAAFNDLVECQRNASSSKYTHQTWESIMNMPWNSEEKSECEQQRSESEKCSNSQLMWPLFGSDICSTTEIIGRKDSLDQELKQLALEQEYEVLELRRKHENAILEAKNRRETKTSHTVQSRPHSDQISTGSSTCTDSNYQWKNFVQASQIATLCPQVIETQFMTVKGQPTSKATVESNRMSLVELTALTTQVGHADMQKGVTLDSDLVGFGNSTVFNEPANETKTTCISSQYQPAAINDGFCFQSQEGSSTVRVPEIPGMITADRNRSLFQGLTISNGDEASLRDLLSGTHDPCLYGPDHLLSENTKGLNECKDWRFEVAPTKVPSIDKHLTCNDLPSCSIQSCSFNNMNPCHDSYCAIKDVGVTDKHLSAGLHTESYPGSIMEARYKELHPGSNQKPKSVIHDGFFSSSIATKDNGNPGKGSEILRNAVKCHSSSPHITHTSLVTETMSLKRMAKSGQVTHGVVCTQKVKPLRKVETEVNCAATRDIYTTTTTPQNADKALELKKEQLQRSIAELEAKTLEGLENGLVANHGTKQRPCSQAMHSPNTNVISHSRP